MAKACWLIVLVLATPSLRAQTTVPAPKTDDIPRLIKDLGAAPLTTTAPASVDALLRQLGTEDWNQREAAQKELIQLGAEALAPLRDLSRRTTDEEVRQRTTIVIQKIEDQQLVGQTLVTIDLTDAPAEQVFAEIARRSFARMPLEVSDQWRAAAPRLTVKARGEPFWQVLKPLCAKARVHPEWRAGGMVLAEGYKGELDGQAVVSGPFLVRLNGAYRRVVGMPLANERITVIFTIYAEPKIHLVNRAINATLKRATDNQDRPIQVMMLRGGIEPAGMAPSTSGIFSPSLMLSVEAGAESLRELVGEIPVTLALRTETMTIDKPLTAGPVRRRINGSDVVIGPLTRENNMYLLTMKFDQQLWNLLGGGTGTFANGGVTMVVDAKGRPFRCQGLTGNSVDAEGKVNVTLGYTAQVGGAEPAQVICTVHQDGDKRDSRIEFEYKDIPIR